MVELCSLNGLLNTVYGMYYSCSVYVSKALHRSLGRMGAPYMTLPFNMVMTCVFLALKTTDVSDTDSTVVSNASAESDSDGVDWLLALRGVLVSFSQVEL